MLVTINRMAKLFRLPLVTLGTHQAPQGPVKVTPERVAHWVESFNRIKAAKNNIPIPWGHQLKAVPVGDADAMRYVKSRWNAGFVERLEKNSETGSLDVVGTIPPGWDVEPGSGDLVNPVDGCRIREVSAGIGNWRDGTGTIHRDIIVHAALCTLPVVAGQTGFVTTLATEESALFSATLSTDNVEYLYTLGGGEKVMKDIKKKDKDNDGLDADGDGLDLESSSDLPPLDPAALAPPVAPAAPSLPMAVPDGNMATEIINLFAACDAALPGDTTPQNLLQNLKVVLTVLQSKGYKFTLPPTNIPQEADAKIDTSMDGAQPESMGPTTSYMSTEADGVVTLSSDASGIVDAWAQQHREAYAREWDRLQATGLPEDIARQEKAHLEKSKPAVDPTTKRVSLPDGKSRLLLARAASGKRSSVVAALTTNAPAMELPALPALTLSTGTVPDAVPEPNPARPDGANGTFDAKAHLRMLVSATDNLQLKSA